MDFLVSDITDFSQMLCCDIAQGSQAESLEAEGPSRSGCSTAWQSRPASNCNETGSHVTSCCKIKDVSLREMNICR